MFIDRTIVVGIVVSLVGLILATAALLYLLTTLKTPQVVRLVSLIPSQSSIMLADVGDSATLTVRGYYSDLSTEDLDPSFITFESTDLGVATVSSDGVVTANDSGFADILIEFGGFSKRVHALVFGDLPTLPAIDPAMVDVIPGHDFEVRVIRNRVIIELEAAYDVDFVSDTAEDLGGKVLLSYTAFPLHVIEFDASEQPLLEVLDGIESDPRVAAAYPDILMEPFHHDIDTLSLGSEGAAYRHAGFDRAWRMMEKVPDFNTVIVSVVDGGIVNPWREDPSIVRSEFDSDRILSIPIKLPKVERLQFTSPIRTTDIHAAAVTSVIAAMNGNVPPPSKAGVDETQINLSGIVTSVEGLPYYVIGMNRQEFTAGALIKSIDGSMPMSSLLLSLEILGLYDHVIDVVNMSWGGRLIPPNWLKAGLFLPTMARMSDVVFVPAAGNCQVDAREYFPANFSLILPNVITVGGANIDYDGRWVTDPACDQYGTDGNASAFGDAVTIAAPAEGVLIVDTSINGYVRKNGTSLAAPMVTGATALLKAIDADATPTDIKELLLRTADVKEICTSEHEPCPITDKENWPFLRADKAVAMLIADRVDAEIFNERVTVPSDKQKVMGNGFEVGVEIENTGKIVWSFYAKAYVRSPAGGEISLEGHEIAIPPSKSHPFKWSFWPNQTGCWDLRVKVWIDGEPASHLRTAIAEYAGVSSDEEDVGLIADSGWWEGVLEVRSDPNQEIQCSSSPRAVPLPRGLTRVDANVLLLADTSGSMEGQKMEALKQAVDVFVNRMYDIRIQGKGGTEVEADYVGLSDFDDSYRGVISIGPVDSTGADLDTWRGAVDHLDAEGGTAFYDAVINSIDILNNEGAPHRNNILIALTDGLDQGSNSSLSDAISALEESSVTLFALALGEPGGVGEYDLEILRDMADATGGVAYVADTDNLSGLYLLFSTIFETE